MFLWPHLLDTFFSRSATMYSFWETASCMAYWDTQYITQTVWVMDRLLLCATFRQHQPPGRVLIDPETIYCVGRKYPQTNGRFGVTKGRRLHTLCLC